MTLPKLIFHYLNERTPVLAEITPTLEDHRAWVAVINVAASGNEISYYKPGEKYAIHRLELHNKYMELYRQDNDITYENATTHEEKTAKDEADLERILSEWVTDFDTFVPSWRSEDPFW